MLLKGYLFQGLNMNEGNIEIVILLKIMGNHCNSTKKVPTPL